MMLNKSIIQCSLVGVTTSSQIMPLILIFYKVKQFFDSFLLKERSIISSQGNIIGYKGYNDDTHLNF